MCGAAERMRFWGYLVLATFVAAVTYPVFGHWAWGDASIPGRDGGADGWLNELGFIDFAGSTVVHSVGGWVALAAVIVLGPRIGRFGPGSVPIRGHDLPLTTLGVFVLWVGWYGFNGCSTYGLTAEVPSVILNTTLAGAFGGLTGLALTSRFDQRPDVVVIMNGSLAGLVGITASANLVSCWQAVLIGVVAAVVMFAVTQGLERLRIDDAVGAVPVLARRPPDRRPRPRRLLRRARAARRGSRTASVVAATDMRVRVIGERSFTRAMRLLPTLARSVRDAAGERLRALPAAPAPAAA